MNKPSRALALFISNWYSGKRVLVTGGTGFIGVNLVQVLASAGADVTVFARNSGDRLPESVRLVLSDIRDPAAVEACIREQMVIFHLAGQSGAVGSMEDPWTDLDVNCRGSLVLLEAVRIHNPSAKVVFPGSRLQFGRPLKVPVDEDHPMEPVCIYGVHRLAAEKYFLLYHKIYGLRTTVVRITNPFGPGQSRKRSAYGVVNWLIHQAIADQPLSIYGDGSQVRDYVFIEDVLVALLRVGATESSDGHVYNLGSGKGVRMVEMTRLIIEIAGAGRVQFVPWPVLAERIETGDFVADISRISNELDWRPEVPLEEGVARTVAAYRESR